MFAVSEFGHSGLVRTRPAHRRFGGFVIDSSEELQDRASRICVRQSATRNRRPGKTVLVFNRGLLSWQVTLGVHGSLLPISDAQAAVLDSEMV